MKMKRTEDATSKLSPEVEVYLTAVYKEKDTIQLNFNYNEKNINYDVNFNFFRK